MKIDGSQIGDAGANVIADFLRDNSTCIALVLSTYIKNIDKNHIDDYGAKVIANGLMTNTAISTLNISEL